MPLSLPIEPGAKARPRSSPGTLWRSGRAAALPQSPYTASTSVSISNASAFNSRASRLLARSLSITASTPVKLPSARRTTGMPPPPAQITITPCPTSSAITGNSRMRCGRGEATTRR